MYLDEYKRWLAADLEDSDLHPELAGIEGNDDEIKDRFAVALKFGTAGLRGVLGAGTNRMNIYVVRQATQEECEAYYNEHKTMFVKEAKATAKHILTATEEESKKVLEEIESGVKTFEDAAKEYSTCPSKAQGGSLGTFGRGQMVKEFDEAVFTAEVSKVIGPVKTDFGYHLIRVDELTGGEQSEFAEVYPQIMQQLTTEKQNKKYMAVRQEMIEKYGLEFK